MPGTRPSIVAAMHQHPSGLRDLGVKEARFPERPGPSELSIPLAR